MPMQMFMCHVKFRFYYQNQKNLYFLVCIQMCVRFILNEIECININNLISSSLFKFSKCNFCVEKFSLEFFGLQYNFHSLLCLLLHSLHNRFVGLEMIFEILIINDIYFTIFNCHDVRHSLKYRTK